MTITEHSSTTGSRDGEQSRAVRHAAQARPGAGRPLGALGGVSARGRLHAVISLRRDRAPDHLAALMGVVGALHFVIPGRMAETIPAQLPARRALVLASGVVEVATAVGLRRRAPWAGPVAAATLVAIWPANIQMALDAGTGKQPGLADNRLLMWGRVPLQLPLIWAALQARPRG